MIRSMTAYASSEGASPLGNVSLELRSVNHRYLEQSFYFPEALRRFEPALREAISQALGRGKISINAKLQADDSAAALSVNEALLERLGHTMMQMDRSFPGIRVDGLEVLKYPGVLKSPDVDDDALQEALLNTLDDALDHLIDSRQREGEKLATVIVERLNQVESIVEDVSEILPEIEQGLRQRLEDKLAELDADVEPKRLEQELVIQVNRADIAEELDRLTAHIAEARRILGLDEPVGRRLDFLMQEFNREANTLGSKSVDIRLTNASMELKVLIEQMREQVQNIE